ncbi:MAG: orotate phosphoribosyltransferase [Acidobacteriota bacterium]
MTDPSPHQARQRLQEILAERSYQRRRVILASGRESDFYFDSKQTVLGAEGAYLTGQLFVDAIAALPEAAEVRAIGGLELGSVPISAAVSVVSHLRRQPWDQLVVRRQPKAHGTRVAVEGASRVPAGSVVVVVEDVVTTGGSSLKAAQRLVEEGYRVDSMVTLIDREEGGREAIESAGFRLRSLFVRGDFE